VRGIDADVALSAAQEKLRRRIASVEIKVINPPRPGKKCLVLDIDYTIFDLVRPLPAAGAVLCGLHLAGGCSVGLNHWKALRMLTDHVAPSKSCTRSDLQSGAVH
jgi:hypothetical protein